MNNLVTHATTSDGKLYLYSVGATDHDLPELIYIPHPDDAAAKDVMNMMGVVLCGLLDQQIAAQKPFADGEVVNFPEDGLRVRLHCTYGVPEYPLVKADERYGPGFTAIVIQVLVEARQDA
jgi:hypothetical protein